jgi:hypothetical protein
VKLGFKNFYVYSAAHHETGEHFSLIIPYLNTSCMNVFLSEFSKHLGDKTAVIVMDQAAWHKSIDLLIPDNISITYLSPHSPELNPVERLWRFIKHHLIRNQIYHTLEELEAKLCDFIQTLDFTIVRSICSFYN